MLPRVGCDMKCAMCTSGNQAEFVAEINIHLSGLKNIDNPGVLAFPRLLICLDCGFTQFTALKAELALLARGTPSSESPIRAQC
jgi:hypothetical protein